MPGNIYVDGLIRHIRFDLAKLERDKLFTVITSPEVEDYLKKLRVRHAEPTQAFIEFFETAFSGAYIFYVARNELLKSVQPEETGLRIRDLVTEIERCRANKDIHVQFQEWEQAVECRDRQRDALLTAQELLADHTLVITPKVLDIALKSLGYLEDF